MDGDYPFGRKIVIEPYEEGGYSGFQARFAGEEEGCIGETKAKALGEFVMIAYFSLGLELEDTTKGMRMWPEPVYLTKAEEERIETISSLIEAGATEYDIEEYLKLSEAAYEEDCQIELD